jgi:hypothetical protein
VDNATHPLSWKELLIRTQVVAFLEVFLMITGFVVPIDHRPSLSCEQLWLNLLPAFTIRLKGYGTTLDVCHARENNLIAIDNDVLSLMTILVHPFLVVLRV